MEAGLSDDTCIVLCDALTEGCPIGHASEGYLSRFGYSQEECRGTRCCGHPLGDTGDRESALAEVAQAAGLPSAAAAAAALDVVASKVVAKLSAMAANTPPSSGFAVALNATKAGELVPCELDMRLQRHPAVDWKYCVVIVRDVSQELSVASVLSTAARGDAALEDLIQARSAAHHDSGGGGGGGGGGGRAFPSDLGSAQYMNGLAAEMFRSRLSGTAEMLKSTRKGKKSATPSIASRSTSSGASSISYVSSVSSSSSSSRAPAAIAADQATEQAPGPEESSTAPTATAPATPAVAPAEQARSRAAGAASASQGSSVAPATSAAPTAAQPVRGFLLHQLAMASGTQAPPPTAAASQSSSASSSSQSSRPAAASSGARQPLALPTLPIRTTAPTLPAARPPPTPVAEASAEEESDDSYGDSPFLDLVEEPTRSSTVGSGSSLAAGRRSGGGSSSGVSSTTRRVRPRPWLDLPAVASQVRAPDANMENPPDEESPPGSFGGIVGDSHDPFQDLLEDWDPLTEVDTHAPVPIPGAPHSWATITPEVAQVRRDSRFQKVARQMARREITDIDFAMVIVDPSIQGCPIVACSAGFNDLVGCRRGEAVGRTWNHLRVGVPPDRICPRTSAEMVHLCQVAAQNKYFCRQDGCGSALLRSYEDSLPEGELTCPQTIMTGLGRLARVALHLKQVELDEEMYVLGIVVGLPDCVEDGRQEDLAALPNGLSRSAATARAIVFTQLRDDMFTALQVLSSQFWLSSPMRRQVARDDLID
mmetsp:Transcript_15932/g.46062  ORF Transcript_15932/g.46062 Transcript_15932/m.46062 type:complete len:766 (-) Transcript_15932:472-2769(-)